jgi:hypothetical protein
MWTQAGKHGEANGRSFTTFLYARAKTKIGTKLDYQQLMAALENPRF